jgi:hypothetical protein
MEESWAKRWQWRGKDDALKEGGYAAAMNVGDCFQAHAIDGGAEAQPIPISPGAAAEAKACH